MAPPHTCPSNCVLVISSCERLLSTCYACSGHLAKLFTHSVRLGSEMQATETNSGWFK